MNGANLAHSYWLICCEMMPDARKLITFFGFWILASSSLANEDLFSPFLVSPDPALSVNLCAVLLNPSLPHSDDLELHSYDYATSEGVIIDDTGFIASYRVAPPTLRKVIFKNRKLEIDRNVTEKEIDEVRDSANKAVARGFEKSVQPEMRDLVEKVEARLLKSQISFGVVRDQKTGKILGSLRVFKGYMSLGKLILPSLEILREEHLLTEEDEANIKAKFKVSGSGYSEQMGVSVSEIGQFNIDPTLPAKQRDAVRSQLLSWLKVGHIENTRGTLFLVHISTPYHERHYGRRYGFGQTLIEKSSIHNSNVITEKLLLTESSALNLQLRELLGLP